MVTYAIMYPTSLYPTFIQPDQAALSQGNQDIPALSLLLLLCNGPPGRDLLLSFSVQHKNDML